MGGMLLALTVFLASFAVAYFLILRIPSLLHTPLMSMTNAISGVTIIGALLIFAVQPGTLGGTFGILAIVLATFNVVGGFVITDRMLKMFKKKSQEEQAEQAEPGEAL